MHREQNASVNGFEAVTQIGDRPADDHGHRIVQIGRAHLMFDADGRPGVLWPLGRHFIIVFRGLWSVAHAVCPNFPQVYMLCSYLSRARI